MDIQKIKVTNLSSPRSRKEVENQFVIRTPQGEYFQSYASIIAFRPYGINGTVLDENYWNFSTTTSRYRNEFLGDTTKDCKDKIKSGEYILRDLN